MNPGVAFTLALEDTYQQGKKTWPAFAVSFHAFAEYLGAIASRSEELVNLTHGDDLFLVCGCLNRCPLAQRTLASSYLDPLLVATVTYQVRDDLRQIVLERLLSCTAGSRPRLSEYSGRASLRTWLRVVVKRCSLNLERELDGKVRRDSSEQLENRLVSVAANPELDFLKARYADEFRRAFRSALVALEARDALVLKMHVCEGARTLDIASCFGVNRVTVTRWLSAIHRQLLVATRRHLQSEFRISSTEFESVVKCVISSLDLTLSGLERAPEAHA